ncbi:MAG: DUF3006 domain-containing protein [Sphingomonadaceae bacterium]
MSPQSPLRATVDRFEHDEQGKHWAVLVFDDGQELVVDREKLPSGVQPHQMLVLRFQIDREETARRAEQIQKLQRELFGE